MVSPRSRRPSAAPHETPVAAGPWGWENARAKLSGQPWAGALEVACYTDALTLDGQASSGPYTAMVPLAYRSRFDGLGESRMSLVIRIERHFGGDDLDEYIDDTWVQQANSVAHGGDAGEELAALLSLALGIRLRAGGIARVFHPSVDDERGFPHEVEGPAPYLPRRTRQQMLPYTMARSVDLSAAAALLDIYPQLSAKQARALVRSARSYQDALWIADSDPRLAWLRLVTATEAVAQLSPSGPAAQTLAAAHPEIAQLLADTGDPELTRMVTEKLVAQSRATAKFLAFLHSYGPPPPSRRPIPQYRVNWRDLKNQFKAIYRHRSADLHQGTPIPWVMCEPPVLSRAEIAQECVWVPDDWQDIVPMRLHMFEFIVRESLLAWWRSIT